MQQEDGERFNQSSLELLTPPMVGRILKISEARVRRLLRTKKLPGFRIGKAWRVSADALGRYLEVLSGQ
jgi:excisionase family DNA binding protein